MAAIKKTFKEIGLLLSKEFKPATKEIEMKENGVTNIIPAQQDRYILKICTSGNIDDFDGMDTPSFVEFKINSGADGIATAEDKALYE